MAVDFKLLPTNVASPNNAPSRFVWIVAFFVMFLVGVFLALLFWPKELPTQTWKFWTCLLLFPLGIPALVVLRRYSAYEGHKLDAALSNEAVQEFNTRVFGAASIPLVLIGAAHRFSSDGKENTTDGIRKGSVVLKTQDPIAQNGEPVKARWFVIPDMRTTPGSSGDDRNRRQLVTAWIFDELRDELLPRIQVLPDHIPLTICLSTSNGFTSEENEDLWRERWYAGSLRTADIAAATDMPVDLMMLDSWMDQILCNANLRATLFVAVQLHPLLAGTPPPGTSEAGAAVLLLPESLAGQHKTARVATLHRPVRGPLDQPVDALSHALRWANVEPSCITHGWRTGLDATRAGALREPAMKLGLSAHTTDLDTTVGHAGIAAPWLALACATSSLDAKTSAQIVFVGQDDQVDCAVLKSANDDIVPPGLAEGLSHHADTIVSS